MSDDKVIAQITAGKVKATRINGAPWYRLMPVDHGCAFHLSLPNSENPPAAHPALPMVSSYDLPAHRLPSQMLRLLAR